MEFTIVFVPRCLTGFYIKKQGFYAMRLNLYYTIQILLNKIQEDLTQNKQSMLEFKKDTTLKLDKMYAMVKHLVHQSANKTPLKMVQMLKK